MNSNLSDNQLKVKNYFEENNLEEILSDMLNTLAHTFEEKPLVFMIKHLSKLCPPEDLERNGIKIESENNFPTIIAIPFPNFEENTQSLFKETLNQDLFISIKNIITTKHHITLRPIVQAALENQNKKIGLYAADGECYESFQQLFTPIIEQINLGITDNNFNYEKEWKKENENNSLLNKNYYDFIENFQLKIKRNLRNEIFNMFINSNSREKICTNLIDFLKKKDFKRIFVLSKINIYYI